MKNILQNERALEEILKGLHITHAPLHERLVATIEFHQVWQTVCRFVWTDSNDIVQRYQEACGEFSKGNGDVKELILNIICKENEVFFANGVMIFPDRRSLWTLIHEILINEDYYFETDTESPRILDCGTHFGLAIYYFKQLYPKARITGFEPVPNLYKLALENVQKNHYDNVEILPYALSNTETRATFFVSDARSMAGSLTKRRHYWGDALSEISVECRRLSQYLNEPVHFLKIDIEGTEDVVLTEAEPFLGNVQHLFCEYHTGKGLDSDRLAKILLTLENAGFDITYIGQSFADQSFRRQQKPRRRRRPLAFTDKPYSVAMWAKNRKWSSR